MEGAAGSAVGWRVARDMVLPLDRAQLMGVLNITPDSFSDGGRYVDVQAALAHAREMIEQGAAIIDIGGESTRPGAQRVDAEAQIRRILPVIDALRAQVDRHAVLISVDTTLEAVAGAALDHGADIINDVSAGSESSAGRAMFELAAARGCGLVLMHRRLDPQHDRYSHEYEPHDRPQSEDIVRDVRSALMQRVEAAVQMGVDRQAIAIDPGLGFGKTVEQNYELIARSAALVATGQPVLSAASRKSFIGAATGVTDPSARVNGSTAISVLHFERGVRLFRVHDVAEQREALAVAAAVQAPARSGAKPPAGGPGTP